MNKQGRTSVTCVGSRLLNSPPKFRARWDAQPSTLAFSCTHFSRGQTRYLVGRALTISYLHTRHVIYKRTDRVKSVQNPFEALDHRFILRSKQGWSWGLLDYRDLIGSNMHRAKFLALVLPFWWLSHLWLLLEYRKWSA